MIAKSNKVILALVTVVIVGSAIYVYNRRGPALPEEPKTAITYNKPADTPTKTSDSAEIDIPASLLIKVPFTPQAPTANWDELHNEACEEASAIMANAYFNEIPSLPPEVVEAEISKLTAWQNQAFGYHLSINTNEVVQMIEANYQLQTETVAISEKAIKTALAENKLVIVPANGQMLGNPFYKEPGPIYHMFVITGFDEEGFITNDPGTKRGENYHYDYATIANATGNWNHANREVNLSDKKIIIVSK